MLQSDDDDNGSLRSAVRHDHRYDIKYSLDTWLANQGRGQDRLPNWNPKNGGMLISQPVSGYLANHSELCISRLLNNQPRRISIYRLQRRPSFGFESSVSSTPVTSDDPVVTTIRSTTNVRYKRFTDSSFSVELRCLPTYSSFCSRLKTFSKFYSWSLYFSLSYGEAPLNVEWGRAP